MNKPLLASLLIFTLFLGGCKVMPKEPEETISVLTIKEAPEGFITLRQNGTPVVPRPQGVQDIEYIMLHAISDAVANPTKPYKLQRITSIFTEYSVEAHYVIDRLGGIYQYVKDDQIAHHAGQGSWNDDPRLLNNLNRFAIGIELLGIGTKAEMEEVIGASSNSRVKAKDRGFTKQQYQSLTLLVDHLQGEYQIPNENIITHKDYDPSRKWDPGILFNWSPN